MRIFFNDFFSKALRNAEEKDALTLFDRLQDQRLPHFPKTRSTSELQPLIKKLDTMARAAEDQLIQAYAQQHPAHSNFFSPIPRDKTEKIQASKARPSSPKILNGCLR